LVRLSGRGTRLYPQHLGFHGVCEPIYGSFYRNFGIKYIAEIPCAISDKA
jgi:hypothetical protein